MGIVEKAKSEKNQASKGATEKRELALPGIKVSFATSFKASAQGCKSPNIAKLEGAIRICI